MNARFSRARALAPLALLPLLAACQTSKSANPLSPSVAGPIPGVEISAPTPVQPAVNASLEADQQPVTLVVENAATTGQRPLTYRVEVAADAGFSTMVFSKDGIAPGGNGKTTVSVPDKLASDRTYFWRARAQDGANTGPYSAVVKFSVVTPVKIGAPTLVSPINNEVAGNPPSLLFSDAPVTGPAGTVSYLIQVSTNEAFTQIVFSASGTETSNRTQVTPGTAILTSTTFYWRVRASAGSITGPWSATGVFKTPAPLGGGGGGGGGGTGGGGTGGGGGSTGGCRTGTAGHKSGALDTGLAEDIVRGTADEYPCLTATFNSDEAATDAAEQLLRRMIWHLQLAGFGSARQKNPSGLISKDKLNIYIGGKWHTYDVFRLGYAGVASQVTFNEVTPPNPQADGGIPD